MNVYLTRHAESEYNAQGLLNSDPSVAIGLTEKGKAQSEQLATLLVEEPIEIIYTSEFQRTQQTTAIINKVLQKPTIIEPLINENVTGFDEQPYSDWEKALKASPDPWSARFNNGESKADAFARTILFVKKIKDSGHQSILVVTHGFHVEALLGLSRGLDGPDAMGQLIPQGHYKKIIF